LAKDYPAIYAEVLSGRISVRAASAKAGLIHLPTRVDALKREWKKANNGQQIEFWGWVRARVPKRALKPIADPDGRLRLPVRAFLSRWIKDHKSKPGRIAKQIGFSVFDPTFRMAIEGGHELRAEVIPELAKWMAKEGFR